MQPAQLKMACLLQLPQQGNAEKLSVCESLCKLEKKHPIKSLSDFEADYKETPKTRTIGVGEAVAA